MDFNAPALSALYLADENTLVPRLIELAKPASLLRGEIRDTASDLVRKARAEAERGSLIDAFLQEYGLSTDEGKILMRLAEALIRTPDFATASRLVRDKLSAGDWSEHTAKSGSNLVNLSTRGLSFSKSWVNMTGGDGAGALASKLGDRILHKAVSHAMGLMGEHFVLGRDIDEAIKKSRDLTDQGYAFSYDMLGEAALTAHDAQRYFQSYLHAVKSLAKEAGRYSDIAQAPGISVKLSALHPRYEYANRAECVPELVTKLKTLCMISKRAGLGLSIDAEEADRLEVSLLIVERLLDDPDLEGWDGFGVVIQAYQRRATAVIDWLADKVSAANRRITVRLVKGAYWDSEVKRAQEMGLESYPVFTRKPNTDVSYLACARKLLEFEDLIFPQFATHNAHTAAAIFHMANAGRNTQRTSYEFQRLHGMGDALHADLIRIAGVRSRIYAPVGSHKDLLPYLVRRLLENGANSSFVNQLFDPAIDIDDIVRDPIEEAAAHEPHANPKISAPRDMFAGARLAAQGLDLTQADIARNVEAAFDRFKPVTAASIIKGKVSKTGECIEVHNPAAPDHSVGSYRMADTGEIDLAIKACGKSKWASLSPEARAGCLNRAALMMETRKQELITVLSLEAGKHLPDCVGEVCEAVDFCRYYANQAIAPHMEGRSPLGLVACISPWNFPLAIFLGQITAALAAGNTVIAKPAQQTPLIAFIAIKLLHEAGVPKDALHLIMGDGAILGGYLTAHSAIDGIVFTGSTHTAKRIAGSLADTGRAQIPFIAETGGLNAMIIDSTALLEQAVGDVVDSAFQSAGQRCSACRIVCVQDDIAEGFIEMLGGAMAELRLGAPKKLTTDVGPVIDAAAQDMLIDYIAKAQKQFGKIAETPLPESEQETQGIFVQPIAMEINSIDQLDREIFGPVLHVVRFRADEIYEVIEQINALGYGLTMGVHSRIDSRVENITHLAEIGNLYINRNQIGAVVGVQPFGGDGLSGTGPKAGGPHYLRRLSKAPRLSLQAYDFDSETSKQASRAPDFAALKKAQTLWANADRYAVFMAAAQAVAAERPMLSGLLKKSAMQVSDIFAVEETLPGPTGEVNTLSLAPRGVIASLGGTEPIENLRQVLMALAAGNAVITTDVSLRFAALVTALETAGLPKGCAQYAPEDQMLTILDGDIHGIADDTQTHPKTADYLCRREGAILPLLSAYDDPERYAVERTVSIDTTAAGGNASLLAMED